MAEWLGSLNYLLLTAVGLDSARDSYEEATYIAFFVDLNIHSNLWTIEIQIMSIIDNLALFRGFFIFLNYQNLAFPNRMVFNRRWSLLQIWLYKNIKVNDI